jgi:hypothetical protein
LIVDFLRDDEDGCFTAGSIRYTMKSFLVYLSIHS